MLPPPLQLLLLMFAGWINRNQQEEIEYLQEENRLLKERLGGRRIRFTDAERRRLSKKAKAWGYRRLHELETLVSPDTLLRWYRELVARKWDFSHRRGPGRPRVMNEIADLILRMAQDNPSWGYTRIQGALANVGHRVARDTIANILRERGIEPAPERGTRTCWSTFLKAHGEGLAAADFLTVEVMTWTRLVTYHVLFVIELASRAVHIAGITTNPNAPWMLQTARNLTDAVDGALREKAVLILDRDTKYSEAFRRLLKDDGIEIIRLPPRSPNLNAFAERFVRSIKEECLNRMIFFGEASLKHAVKEYMIYYHAERNHQGMGNRLLKPITTAPSLRQGSVNQRQRLDGMLNFYYRDAA